MSKNSNYLFKLDLLILSLLKEKDMYAYEICKDISKKSNGIIIPKNGTLYPVVYKLIDSQYISTYNEVVNNKTRVYYHLEEAGEEYLNKLIDDYINLTNVIDLIINKNILE